MQYKVVLSITTVVEGASLPFNGIAEALNHYGYNALTERWKKLRELDHAQISSHLQQCLRVDVITAEPTME
jgi:hypothetical protein